MEMTNEAKNAWDLLLNAVTLVGAAVAFAFGLHQWRRGQDWQRAEQMDKFIQEFQNNDLLSLAATVIDWTRREVTFRGQPFVVTNTDALLALRDHSAMGENPVFKLEQATLRDAYDALLAFFQRLELAISTQLVDAPPAVHYFRYWLGHFLAFDKHPDVNNELKGRSPREMVAGYIEAYADPASIQRLCRLMNVPADLKEFTSPAVAPAAPPASPSSA